MEKMFVFLAESGSKSGIPAIYLIIAAVVFVIAGYFLLRKRKI
jgi:LPXTG-motif cell wall-anchored protein